MRSDQFQPRLGQSTHCLWPSEPLYEWPRGYIVGFLPSPQKGELQNGFFLYVTRLFFLPSFKVPPRLLYVAIFLPFFKVPPSCIRGLQDRSSAPPRPTPDVRQGVGHLARLRVPDRGDPCGVRHLGRGTLPLQPGGARMLLRGRAFAQVSAGGALQVRATIGPTKSIYIFIISICLHRRF